MTFIQILRTLFEIVMVTGLIWCIFHEDRLIAFEEKVFSAFRRKQLHIAEVKRVRS